MTDVYSLREESRLHNNCCRTGTDLYNQHGQTNWRIFRRAGKLRIMPHLTRGFCRKNETNIKNFKTNKIKYNQQNKQKIYKKNDTKSFKK